MSAKENVFDQLQGETETLKENSKQLEGAFEELAKSNGSGDPIRKKLRHKLTKQQFLQTLETR